MLNDFEKKMFGAVGRVKGRFSGILNLSLGWHLLWIILLKLVVLYVLWLVFVQPYKVVVNREALSCLYSSSSGCSRPILNQSIKEIKP